MARLVATLLEQVLVAQVSADGVQADEARGHLVGAGVLGPAFGGEQHVGGPRRRGPVRGWGVDKIKKRGGGRIKEGKKKRKGTKLVHNIDFFSEKVGGSQSLLSSGRVRG